MEKENVLIQKSGYIILPFGTNLEKFLKEKSLEIFWTDEEVKEPLEREKFLSDEKHPPNLVPITITVPFSALKIVDQPRKRNNNRRLNNHLGAVEVNLGNELAAVVERAGVAIFANEQPVRPPPALEHAENGLENPVPQF